MSKENIFKLSSLTMRTGKSVTVTAAADKSNFAPEFSAIRCTRSAGIDKSTGI